MEDASSKLPLGPIKSFLSAGWRVPVDGVLSPVIDRPTIAQRVFAEPSIFGSLPDKLQADKTLALVAVRRDGTMLRFASDALRADPEVVTAAVTQDAGAWKFAAETLLVDRDFVLAAVTEAGLAL